MVEEMVEEIHKYFVTIFMGNDTSPCLAKIAKDDPLNSESGGVECVKICWRDLQNG